MKWIAIMVIVVVLLLASLILGLVQTVLNPACLP
jgi:hypothetical protein